MKRSHIIHTVALCILGFAGSRVLCKNCFASFIAQLMTFVMSSPVQSPPYFRNRCLISSRFFLIQSRLVFLCLTPCSSVSVCRCLISHSCIVFLRLAPCSSVSVCCCFVTHSRIVFLCLALSSWVSNSHFLFIHSKLIFLH